jgi:hypothetical protein
VHHHAAPPADRHWLAGQPDRDLVTALPLGEGRALMDRVLPQGLRIEAFATGPLAGVAVAADPP